MLTNLVGNALKFTDEGFVEIGYSIKDKEALFYVKDKGPGIPEEEQNTIFERFRQLDNTLTRKYGGAGLGLAISKNLVERLDGNMSLKSLPGQGTTFYFAVPGITGETDLQQQQLTPALSDNLPAWNDKVVLIAEDEISNFDYLQAILRKTEIHILHARNGKEAIALCHESHKPDMLLMDLRMPEIDGFKSLNEIRKVIPDIPAIAQTAFAMSDERQKCLTAGFNDYLSKPIKPDVLIRKMHEYLSITNVKGADL